MNVGVSDLRYRAMELVAAVESGERVTLTLRGEPVADIVPHRRRSQWLEGAWLERELATKAADPALAGELAVIAGQTLKTPPSPSATTQWPTPRST